MGKDYTQQFWGGDRSNFGVKFVSNIASGHHQIPIVISQRVFRNAPGFFVHPHKVLNEFCFVHLVVSLSGFTRALSYKALVKSLRGLSALLLHWLISCVYLPRIADILSRHGSDAWFKVAPFDYQDKNS